MNQSEGAVQPGISPAAQFYMSLKAEGEAGAPPAAAEGDTGQGAQSQELDPGLFPGIEDVPSEYRQHIDPILRQMDTNANKRISDVNEKLEQWAPYEQLGVRDAIDPETMQGLINFVEMLGSAQENPAELKDWWDTLGKEFKFFDSGQEENENELFEENENGNETPNIRDMVQEVMQEVVQEHIAPLQEKMQNDQRDQQLGQVNERIDNEFGEIQGKFGKFSDDEKKNSEIEARIIRLAIPYANENNGEGSILKGFEEYQSILKDGEGSLFQEVSNQPAKPEGPGTPDTTKDKPTDMKEAEQLAKTRLAQTQ